ncbi:MAG: cytochrome c [Deltaproteobacteria bacterium]|nr:cytochrome c [Deltaproteobacteria bacterium]
MRLVVAGAVAAAVVAVAAWALWPDHQGQHRTVGGTTGTASKTSMASTVGMPGQAIFNQKCAVCHGAQATGSPQGPPLIHPYYEPGHHSDMAFVLAVRRGVRAHHWRYGNMPPVPGLSDADVRAVIDYVRALQRAKGIF